MKSRLFVAFIFALVLAGPASSVPMLLSATSLRDELSDFTVVFNDTGDLKLDIGEITFFSGLIFDGNVLLTQIVRIPPIEDVANCGNLFGANCNSWGIINEEQGTSLTGLVEWFSYSVTALNAVPVTGSLSLLAIGLAGLASIRRKRI